jgi:nucleoside-triphosphatase THEP1
MTGMENRRRLGILALVCIAVQFEGSLLLSLIALVIWLSALALWDRISLRRMWMPKFWLITMVFAMGSGVLLGQRDMTLLGISLSRMGLEAGVLMVLRGALIFGLASWASRALTEEDFFNIARRLGAVPLGTAIPVALRLLPELTERLRQTTAGAKRRHMGQVAEKLISATASLAEEMALHRTQKRLLVAVVGPQGSGKTTTLMQIVDRLQDHGFSVGGVVQPAVFEEGCRSGYLLRDVSSGKERPFATRAGRTTKQGLGFEFKPEAWDRARQCIQQARLNDNVVVVDELGRLEARGQGHARVLKQELEGERARLWLLGIRSNGLAGIRDWLGELDLVLELAEGDSPDVDQWFTQISELLNRFPATHPSRQRLPVVK